MEALKTYSIAALVFSVLLCGCVGPRPEPGQTVFLTPEAAENTLKNAISSNDTDLLMAIFGSRGKDIVFSGDEKCDADSRIWFTKKANEKMQLLKDENTALIEIGNDGWPFPVPIARSGNTWFFHTDAGLEELMSRRIGMNEINTMKVCTEIVSAQKEFSEFKASSGAAGQYASKFRSDKGEFNGLYWNDSEGKFRSPLGIRLAVASLETPVAERRPYNGYYYKILTAQGPDAPGGAKSYIVDGKMTGGFAVLAYPSEYGVSGIKTFIVSRNGVIFEKDLGQKTEQAASELIIFDPDQTWTVCRQ